MINKKYAIICGSRTGSTYLSDLLTSSRRCGNPKEYFNPNLMDEYKRQLNLHKDCGYFNYIDKLLNKTSTENHVFGVKIVGLDQFKLLQDHGLKITHWIYLKREDDILQAISRYIAWSTNGWHRETPRPQYSYDGIEWCVNAIQEENQFFESFIKDKKKMEISYEGDICQSPEQTVISILQFLSVTLEDVPGITGVSKPPNLENVGWKQNWVKEFNSKQENNVERKENTTA